MMTMREVRNEDFIKSVERFREKLFDIVIEMVELSILL